MIFLSIKSLSFKNKVERITTNIIDKRFKDAICEELVLICKAEKKVIADI